ncbi:hypothetical protein RvY_10066 [Ramazzottius varieornatus]|uniref:Uncharacterized protein n=1 Tax=Ramazzottius varieornatus TaxID=947166 RepID=A0A1D1VBJ5_RAMVA|nr:hypothetical protein RvY_10066 [Ramazzottius varieornatus]
MLALLTGTTAAAALPRLGRYGRGPSRLFVGREMLRDMLGLNSVVERSRCNPGYFKRV